MTLCDKESLRLNILQVLVRVRLLKWCFLAVVNTSDPVQMTCAYHPAYVFQTMPGRPQHGLLQFIANGQCGRDCHEKTN